MQQYLLQVHQLLMIEKMPGKLYHLKYRLCHRILSIKLYRLNNFSWINFKKGKILFAYFRYSRIQSHFLFWYYGEVREWLNRPVSKTGISAMVSRVRIPSSPILSEAQSSVLFLSASSHPFTSTISKVPILLPA